MVQFLKFDDGNKQQAVPPYLRKQEEAAKPKAKEPKAKRASKKRKAK